MNIAPITLEGRHVQLQPLSLDHEEGLWAAAQTDAIWEFLPFDPSQSREQMHAWVQHSLQQVQEGERVWFVVVRPTDHRVLGATSYMEISTGNRSLEIGGTWLTPEVWRTAINTECKYLLLRHAFETLGCLRVQLKTDSRNVRSQRAIARLGAVKEGVLRKHMIVKDGYQRDTVMYSIVDTEWPAVKRRLEDFLGGRTTKDEG